MSDASAIAIHQGNMAKVVMDIARKADLGITEAKWRFSGVPCQGILVEVAQRDQNGKVYMTKRSDEASLAHQQAAQRALECSALPTLQVSAALAQLALRAALPALAGTPNLSSDGHNGTNKDRVALHTRSDLGLHSRRRFGAILE